MKWLILLPALLLVSCNREERPEAPTAAEAEQLNEAGEMLNDLAKEEGPEAEASSPSNRSE